MRIRHSYCTVASYMQENNTPTQHYSILIAVFCFVMAFSAGCQPGPVQQGPQNSNTSNLNTNANVPNASNSNSNTDVARDTNFPVTMPVIDAMFEDESFAGAAKSSAQLTDEELDKIRDAARSAVLQMSSDPSEDEQRSTRSSTEGTQREIEKLVGKQKAASFISFVRTRWAGESNEFASAAPNSVPTDTRIVVNAPAYRMDVFKDGKLTKTYKIGIGYPEFPLPVGLRRANQIIFNPAWTPPDEPWVKGKVQPGKKVEAGSKLNPLGPIKIPIGLPSLVHGGKDPSRLGTFASHGCVGLTNSMVQDFALEIASLGDGQLTQAEIKEFTKEKDKTKEFNLPKPVPVELRYETIVVEDGKLHIYRDVYERNTNTEENLRRVLETFGVSFDQLSESDKTKLRDAIIRMAVDAQGNIVTDTGNNNSANMNAKNVTRNIKGQKEIVVEIAALQGKGYPPPVTLVQK
jgi:lipoprotein-anchoring transpeptidase ErfK/SrfK